MAAIHIQNNAPGPPETIAVATPTIFPVPIVAESAVQSAAKLDTSPFPSSSSDENIYLIARGNLIICNPLSLTVKNTPVAKIKMISGNPQTKLSTFPKKSVIVFNIYYLSFYFSMLPHYSKICICFLHSLKQILIFSFSVD